MVARSKHTSRGGGSMTTGSTIFSLLNILIAKFAAGRISIDELWDEIDSLETSDSYGDGMFSEFTVEADLENSMSDSDVETGI